MPSLPHSDREVHSDGTTTNTTSDGATVRTADASARPDAGLGQKLAGDAKGGVAKATGSLQAAAGAATNNEHLKQQGLDKMQAEDQRLAAKHGRMPLGTSLREKASGQQTAEQIPATTSHSHTNTAAPATTTTTTATGAADNTTTPTMHGGLQGEGGHAPDHAAQEQV